MLIAQQLSQDNTGNLELTTVLQLMMKAFIALNSQDKRLGFINKNIAFVEPQEVFIQNFKTVFPKSHIKRWAHATEAWM